MVNLQCNTQVSLNLEFDTKGRPQGEGWNKTLDKYIICLSLIGHE